MTSGQFLAANLPQREITMRLRRRFHETRGHEPRLFSAPGRVNLIGEHTDYNDGFVLPMAIERRTFIAGVAQSGGVVSVESLNTGESATFQLDRPGPKRRGSWLDYVEGTAQALIERGWPIYGAQLVIWSNLEVGAGLSSSAALEVCIGYALARLAGLAKIDLISLARAGQYAEHTYVGTRSGIMDQFAVALAERGCAMLLDCRSLERRNVALDLDDACILVCDTRVKHELANSAYNERRAQCEQGVILLRDKYPQIRALRDVSWDEYAVVEGSLPGVIAKRCRHVITENDRTLKAAAALERGDLREVGLRMTESHRSLRDCYEVSCAELDCAVEAALAQPGVFGARMTGGGFGGCTVTLVKRGAVERVSESIRAVFTKRFGHDPELFTTGAAGGVRDETRFSEDGGHHCEAV